MLLLTTSTTTTTTTQPSFHCRACLFCLFVPGFRTPFSLAGSSTRTLHSTPRLERCRQTCPCPGSSARSATSTSKSSVSGVCGRSSSSCFESSLSRLNERQTGACSLRCQTGSSGFQVSLAGCRERGGDRVCVCVCVSVCVCLSVCGCETVCGIAVSNQSHLTWLPTPTGVPYKSSVHVRPTENCLVNLSEQVLCLA